MRVFVTGGTGAIGGYAVPGLVAAGHEVSALARTPGKAKLLQGEGVTPVEVSLFDTAALRDAFGGHDAVVNLATAIPPTSKFMSSRAWAANQRVRTEGSAAVVDAALAAGVGRVVQESVSVLYADGGAAEANTGRFRDAGGAGVVLRFGWFYGPGAAHSEQMLGQARHHLILTLGDPDGYQSSIHLADASAAVVASLSVLGGVYNVVDDEPLTKRDFAAALAAAAGRTPWVRGPGRAARIFGDHLTSLTRSVRARSTRLRSTSDWAPRYPSAREGWTATAEVLNQLRQQR